MKYPVRHWCQSVSGQMGVILAAYKDGYLVDFGGDEPPVGVPKEQIASICAREFGVPVADAAYRATDWVTAEQVQLRSLTLPAYSSRKN